MPVLYLVEQGATLRKDGDVLVITKDGQTLAKVQAIKVEQVVVLGNINLTTPVIHFLLQQGVDCVFCSSFGKYHGRLFSSESGFGLLRQNQLKAVMDPTRKLNIAREIVRGKLTNQRTLLLRYQREKPSTELEQAVNGIHASLERLDKEKTADALQGLEGHASALYYLAFKGLLRQELGFEARVRRPPTDPVNSLLSFGYTLLTYAMHSAVHVVGLDPFLGFLHALRYSRPSLALDLIEEFRSIIVDSVVLRAVNTGVITPHDFRPPEESERGVFLTEDGIKKFIQQFEERMLTQVFHPLDGIRVTYRRCLELQARRMAHAVMGQAQAYEPFLVK